MIFYENSGQNKKRLQRTVFYNKCIPPFAHAKELLVLLIEENELCHRAVDIPFQVLDGRTLIFHNLLHHIPDGDETD